MAEHISEIVKRELTKRYYKQCELSPAMSKDISLELYLRRNLKQAIYNRLKQWKQDEKNFTIKEISI